MHQRPFTLRSLAIAGLALLVLSPNVSHAQKISPAPPAKRTGGEELADFIRLYEADAGGVSRFYDLPWSATRFDRMERLRKEWLAKLEAVNFDALTQQGRIDYLLLRNKLTADLSRGSLERRRLAEMEELLPFRETLQKLEQARWQRQLVNAQEAATLISGIPDQLKKLRERLEKGKKTNDEKPKSAEEPKSDAKTTDSQPLKISPTLARRTAGAVGELRETLRHWFSFYDGYQPDFSWWLKKPNDEASRALEEYSKFLREEIAGLKGKDEDPLLGDPVGEAALANDLEAEMIPYTPVELIAIGEREFAWCEARMKEAAKEMGLGEDWKAALARVKLQFVPPGKQDEFVAGQARAAIDFMKTNRLVSVPPLCEETWRLSMISPETQKSIPFAAYSSQNIMVAYAREDMKHEDKLMSMRGNNRHFTRIVTAHELIPGHHLQNFFAARHHTYRGMFNTPFFVEGWPLYWEMRLWDLNFAQSPEDRVGMLFWRMHRCARIIVSLKFHLGQMTPAQMVEFLTDRVGHEKLGATSEVRRYIAGNYSPLYQAGYMLGGLQLRALHGELVGTGKLTEQQFHDTVLTYNSMPVELIRAGMSNLPLSRETKAAWKFAGPAPQAR